MTAQYRILFSLLFIIIFYFIKQIGTLYLPGLLDVFLQQFSDNGPFDPVFSTVFRRFRKKIIYSEVGWVFTPLFNLWYIKHIKVQNQI
jgi:hypothetical protein